MSKKRKREKMSLPRKIVFVIALMVFVGAAGVIIDHYVTGWRAEKALNELEKFKVEQADMKTDKGSLWQNAPRCGCRPVFPRSSSVPVSAVRYIFRHPAQ